jgi:putative transposase
MQAEGLRSQTGYRWRPGFYGGKPTVASPNHLARQFNVSEPNKVWVRDITYIRTYEGWLYLAVVLPMSRHKTQTPSVTGHQLAFT